jgi:ribosomal protein S18 acetylase RimI-like enzyme
VLLTLVVRADVRQQGVGRMLLQALLEQAAQRSTAG